MIRTRIAPSPTGYPHIGTIYQALFDFAFAKRHHGSFIVRIEDTDRERFVEDAEEKIFQALDFFNLKENESPREKGQYGPYRQSERLTIYKKFIQELIEKGGAYYCFCTKERLDQLHNSQQENHLPMIYDKKCRNLSKEETDKKLSDGERFVVRLKIPDRKLITVTDQIRGNINFEANLLEDAVMIKSDSYPTYHFASVVDDHLMDITHVIRGEEWLSSLPKHVILYEYFGWEKPLFFHTATLRNPDKSKLSKRHGHASVDWYKEQGFLPEAILNFLALMGWSHPEGKEEFDLNEFIQLFDPKDLRAVGPIFDVTKLEWINGVYIRKMDTTTLRHLLLNYFQGDKDLSPVFASPNADLLIGLAQSRMRTLRDFKDLVLNNNASRDFTDEEKKIAQKLHETLSGVEHIDWRDDRLLETLKNFNKENGTNMKLLYFLITGREQGLPLIETMIKIEGRDEILRRLSSLN